MNIIQPRVEIIDEIDGQKILQKIELCGRVCYKSEHKASLTTTEQFVEKLIELGHESVLEHVNITVKFITDRAIANEIVRHRIASYSQESTRYCNYKDCDEIIASGLAYDISEQAFNLMLDVAKIAKSVYNNLVEIGTTPQFARDVLPLGLTKTELIMTANLREWRHFFKLRTNYFSHPKFRKLAGTLMWAFVKDIPIIFNDVARDAITDNLEFSSKEMAYRFVDALQLISIQKRFVTFQDCIKMIDYNIAQKYPHFYYQSFDYGWDNLSLNEYYNLEEYEPDEQVRIKLPNAKKLHIPKTELK